MDSPPVYPTTASFTVSAQTSKTRADSGPVWLKQTSVQLQALSAQTSAHMLEKWGRICILFPSRLDAWSEGGRR